MLVHVRAKQERGFFRAGRLWPMAGVVVDLEEATVDALRAEPMLSVREATDEEAGIVAVSTPTDDESALRQELAEAAEALRELSERLAKRDAEIERLHARVAELEELVEGATAPAAGGESAQ